MKKNVVVNVAIGTDTSWYHSGQARLKESLFNVNSFLTSELYFERRENPITSSPYEDKILAVKEAAALGYKKILWLDCSITAIQPLDKIWDYIERQGYYLYQSGYNCAQTCNDRSLIAYGVNRDQAVKMYECASNVVGFDLERKSGKELFDWWIASLQTDANRGLKWPNENERMKESTDQRFQFHRQDQSTLSLAAGILNLPINDREGHFVCRAENIGTAKNENTIFILKGGE